MHTYQGWTYFEMIMYWNQIPFIWTIQKNKIILIKAKKDEKYSYEFNTILDSGMQW